MTDVLALLIYVAVKMLDPLTIVAAILIAGIASTFTGVGRWLGVALGAAIAAVFFQLLICWVQPDCQGAFQGPRAGFLLVTGVIASFLQISLALWVIELIKRRRRSS